MEGTKATAGQMLRASAYTRRVALSSTGVVAVTLCTLAAIDTRDDLGLRPGYDFLRWNLFLACIPLVLAYVLDWASRRHATLAAVPVLAVAWILFLPNAPYLVTDVVHIRELFSVANAITLALVALTGLLIAVKSVHIVQRAIERRAGEKWGWRSVQAIVLLTAFGVYLGRVQRWNSWNVVSHPEALLNALLTGLSQPASLALALFVTVGFATALYGAYRVLTTPTGDTA